MALVSHPFTETILTVRALYTINGGPQYLLALSPRKFPVTVIRLPSANDADTNILYGRAILKPFLEMICTGRYAAELIHVDNYLTIIHSPDVVQIEPGKKDFTIYVLDPLEARHVSPVLPSGSSPPPNAQPGIAIGLGLLSAALYDGECDTTVAGTILTDTIQEERLEVVFALREVCASCPLPVAAGINHLRPLVCSASGAHLSTF